MKYPVTIRLIEPGDHQAVLDVYAPYVEHTATSFEYEVPAIEAFASRIEHVVSFYPWLVALVGGQVAGYAYAQGHRSREAYQWSAEASVYVGQRYHRMAIGKRLYLTLFHILQLQGIVQVYAGITLPNTPSETFHRALGFKPVGIYQKVGYKMGEWHDVQWFALSLKDPVAEPAAPLSIDEVSALPAFRDILV